MAFGPNLPYFTTGTGFNTKFGPVVMEAAWTRLDAGLEADGFGDVDLTVDTLTIGARFPI